MAKTAKKKSSRTRRKADPVLTEIIRNGVIAVTEEMKTNLMRTAYNMIIYEALDFTTGLFTAEGDTVSIGIGLPSFTRGMSNTVSVAAYSAALATCGLSGLSAASRGATSAMKRSIERQRCSRVAQSLP